MRKILLLTSLLATWLTCTPALAATSTDFYVGLLKRGAADVEAGRFESAITPLRLAAFGLVETIDHYETALAYLAIALNRTGEKDRAQEVLQRILAAERIERRFARLQLPESIRTQFDALARTQLTSAEAAALAAPPAATPQQTAPAVQTPARTGSGVSEARPAPSPSKQPARVKQEPKPLPHKDSKPKQAVTQTQTSQSAAVEPKPVIKTTAARTAGSTATRAVVVADASSRLAAADRALSTGNLNDARRIYRELLATQQLDHAMGLRVAEGLYRSRDFSSTLAAFEKVEPLRAGEEAYRYYVAVALFETGQYARARQELAAALPYIELTPDVLRYRKKIEDAR